MPDHALDDPVWLALTGPHRSLALGGPLGLRYPPEVSPFAAVSAVDDPRAWAELAEVTAAGDSIAITLAPGVVVRPPSEWALVRELDALQLVAPSTVVADDEGLDVLGADDAAEMLALAELTRPGPFGLGTVRFGGFLGVRREGRLVAMAGRRLHPSGWVEVSGVCTHPDFRGRGLSRRLVAAVTASIHVDGDGAFLHVMRSNTTASGLYESMGFTHRADLAILVFQRH